MLPPLAAERIYAGRAVAPEQGEESPSFQGQGCLVTRGSPAIGGATESATEKTPPPIYIQGVRVKRWCKRPPGPS